MRGLLPFLPEQRAAVLPEEEQNEAELQQLINTFSGRLSVSPVKKTQLVKISFESSDPLLAAVVANAVGDTYIEQDLQAQMGLTKKASGWLTTRLSDLRIRLKASEDKLQRYLEQEDLVNIKGVLGLVSNELQQTSQQLVVARNDKNKLQSIVRVINEYGRDNLEMLQSISEITSHKVIQAIKLNLSAAELKVSELTDVYGAKHPKMVSAKAELAITKEHFASQILRLVEGVEKELNSNKRNVSALEKELVSIRARFQKVSRKVHTYRQLSREVETNRQIYDTFFSRSKETEVTGDFNSAVARFTDRAFRPSAPIHRKKTLIVLFAFVATLGLGVVAAFVIEALNDTFKTQGDVEGKLDQRMLGLLPLVKTKRKASLITYHSFEEDGKPFAESMRTIRTSYVLTQLEKDSKVVAVTSSEPGEGKTTTAINLAFSFGQMESTILIDGDMRKPSIGRHFNIPARQPGLAHVIAGSETLGNCIYHDEQSGIDVIPCGQLPGNPLELLSSKRFLTLLTVLKSKYSHVVIDTAPISAVSDSLVIARLTDAVIFVVKSDDTRIGMAQHGLGRLTEANANIAGVVLNKVDTRKLSHGGYYPSYFGSYQYGEGQAKVNMAVAKKQAKAKKKRVKESAA